jgi:hypothetical protein
VTRDHGPNNIRSRELSMVHVSKAMASHLLLRNFTPNKVTNAHNKANSVDPSAFLPQRNLCLIKLERQKDLKLCNELEMDIIDVHKIKSSTSITRIVLVTSMGDVTSLCINICAVISAITSDKGPKPILCQVLSTISQLIIYQDWDKWMETCGTAMPHLHSHFYLFIDRIWALLAQGATDFNNTNVIMGNHPINNLNLTHHSKEIHVLKALLDQVSLTQSQGSPILVQASIVTNTAPNPSLQV